MSAHILSVWLPCTDILTWHHGPWRSKKKTHRRENLFALSCLRTEDDFSTLKIQHFSVSDSLLWLFVVGYKIPSTDRLRSNFRSERVLWWCVLLFSSPLWAFWQPHCRSLFLSSSVYCSLPLHFHFAFRVLMSAFFNLKFFYFFIL